MQDGPTIIRRKIALPPLADRLVNRPRVAATIAELIESTPVVWVTATAGAGKTTAIVQAVNHLDRPLAWLALDDSDAAPGRLLVYLEATLAGVVPQAAEVASRALAARIPHEEAAGLLAESTTGTPLVLVLDGIEHLAGDDGRQARGVLGALARYAPPQLRIVFASRVDVAVDVGAFAGIEQVVSIGESDLAFTTQEAAQALAQIGTPGVDAALVVSATGGWVTGVLFEAWRSREHISGMGGEADPLHGYLASQILSRLDPADTEFLVRTALLDEVSAARGAALGQHDAGDRLVSLRTQHLPVTWSPGTHHMRCHPRFREYLIARLERRDPLEVGTLRRSYGDLLYSEGLFEEAVEQFIGAHAFGQAVTAAEPAIASVINRLDLAVAERWLQALQPTGATAATYLASAELMLAIAHEDYRRGGAIADRLATEGRRADMARSDSMAASLMAWCYWHLAREDDARTVISLASKSTETEAINYLLALVGHAPAAKPPSGGGLHGGPLDALLMRVHYAHGRLQEVSVPPTLPWASAVSTPWRVGALRATGHLEQALELYRAAGTNEWAPAWLHGMVGPELMIDLGEIDAAREVLEKGRQLIADSGSIVFDWLNKVIEAKLELRLAHNPAAALRLLDQLEAAGARRYDFVGEAIDTWLGLALLIVGERDQQAVRSLREAVHCMVAAGRNLDLPIAAVYLAEAEWRNGDPDAADAAADLALTAAQRQGSNHQLLLALADFPAVVGRRLDAESGTDSPWHELGRALMARGVPLNISLAPVVTLAEFGRTAITVDGHDVKPRIAKSVTLLAYLVSIGARRPSRDELLAALFDGRADDSSRAYLRQAVHRLREALPAGLGPSFAHGLLAFSSPVVLLSESTKGESLLAQASRLRDGAQLDLLLRALEIFDQGEYLPGIDSDWATARRDHLETVSVSARLQAAQLTFAAERYQQAEQLAEAVLAQDPYKESAWRLIMRIGSAVGDEDRVIAAFSGCVRALNQLGTEPSDSTRQLFDRLRR